MTATQKDALKGKFDIRLTSKSWRMSKISNLDFIDKSISRYISYSIC
jgi:hypothetical protein